MDSQFAGSLSTNTFGNAIIGNTEAAFTDPNFVKAASTDAFMSMFEEEVENTWSDFAAHFDFSSEGIQANLTVLALAIAPEDSAIAEGVEESIVIEEDMLDRVGPAAEKLGAEIYKPVEASESQWLGNNKNWINDKMDAGYKIYDVGPAPGRAMYPEATSKFYRMEIEEIANRGYTNYKKHRIYN